MAMDAGVEAAEAMVSAQWAGQAWRSSCRITHKSWNESQKEFLFGVLEDLSQDIGFWSIICVISHVTLQNLLTLNKRYLRIHLILLHNA